MMNSQNYCVVGPRRRVVRDVESHCSRRATNSASCTQGFYLRNYHFADHPKNDIINQSIEPIYANQHNLYYPTSKCNTRQTNNPLVCPNYSPNTHQGADTIESTQETSSHNSNPESLHHRHSISIISDIHSPGSHLKPQQYPICPTSRISTPSLLAVLLLTLFWSSHHASTCLGFDILEHRYDPHLFSHNYFNQPMTTMDQVNTASNSHYNNNPRSLTSLPAGLSLNRVVRNDDSSFQGGPSNLDLSSMVADDQDTLDTHIRNILIPRVSGTPGNIKVRQYIANHLRAIDYHVELDEFTSPTPIGNVKFANIIASSNPKACRQLTLACHYDSKMMDNFLGATDSAVPCAMLLKMAEKFRKSFREDSDVDSDDSLGLRFIFFDGEEAFVTWSPTDSLYGSRHLAEKWHKQPAPSHCNVTRAGKSNELARMELLMVLDLIGASDSNFVMYSQELKHHYQALQKYEKNHLTRMGYSSARLRRETAFKSGFVSLYFTEDDHTPFLKKNVPILSLLAHPFPKVWHTIYDNYNAIDFPKTRRTQSVLEEFVANYKKLR